MKVAIYARVSTEKQELDHQIAACRRFCDFKQFQIGEIFSEIGSGKSFKRPRLLAMIAALRRREFDAVVCFRFDRLGRNMQEVVLFFEEMEAKGIQIYSVNENLDVSTPIGRAMRDIILRLAQLERENIAEATKQRLQAMRDAGKPIGRPKGSKDKNARRKSGYWQRWASKKPTPQKQAIVPEEKKLE
jgi:DNA invertase Pin-like site-specific DNA recombinase